MNPRETWFWLIIAAALCSVIVAQRHMAPKAQPGPELILPHLKAAQVTRVEVLRDGEPAIRAERVKEGWRLIEPMVYPARRYAIEHLIGLLEQMRPATYIAPGDLKARPNSDAEYGLRPPRVSIVLRQNNYEARLLVGATTAPGDQVFLQVVGTEGMDVVDAGLLKWIPQSPNDWRDTSLISIDSAVIESLDRLSVTNGAKVLELQRDNSRQWRIVTPPIQARADNARLEELFRQLATARATGFVTDDPKADLDAYGLQTPSFQLALGKGTNTVVLLNFGKSPTNDATQVYVQNYGHPTILTAPKDLLAPWQASVSEFRDPHLLNLSDSLRGVEVRGEEKFSLERSASNSWRVLPLNVPADPDLLKEFLTTFAGMQIVDYTKDAVTAPDLPAYGLANPSRSYIFISAPADGDAASTNAVRTELDFGTNRDNKIYVRRPDESSIYAVNASDYMRLPIAGYQFRARRIWDVPIDDVAGATIEQGGKTRRIERRGAYQWSLAASQGVINDLAVEESIRYLCNLSAGVWLAHGADSLPRYGFGEKDHKVTLQLKDKRNLAIEFGGPSPSESAYAEVVLDGEPWIFEFPPSLYRFVGTYLTIPASP